MNDTIAYRAWSQYFKIILCCPHEASGNRTFQKPIRVPKMCQSEEPSVGGCGLVRRLPNIGFGSETRNNHVKKLFSSMTQPFHPEMCIF